MFTTLAIVALAALSLWGYGEMQRSLKEEAAIHAQVDGIADLQASFYRWLATRVDVDGARYITAPPLSDVTEFARQFWPSDPLTNIPPVVQELNRTPLSTPPAEEAAFLVSNVPHGGGRHIGMDWKVEDNVVKAYLFGKWTPIEVARLQGTMPYIDYHPEAEVTSLPHFGGLMGGTSAVRIDLTHPGSTASMMTAVRRFATSDASGVAEGMMTPLAFDPGAEVTENKVCGEEGAISIDAIGMPMACLDINQDGQREWTPIGASAVYCRQASAAMNDPEYTRNMPGAIPVIEVTLNEYTAPASLTREVRTLGVRTSPTEVACPRGFNPVDENKANSDPDDDDLCVVRLDAAGAIVP